MMRFWVMFWTLTMLGDRSDYQVTYKVVAE
jgi:hypothetical protein